MKAILIDPVARAIVEVEVLEDDFNSTIGASIVQPVMIGMGNGGVPVIMITDEEGLLKTNQRGFSFYSPTGVTNFVGKALLVGEGVNLPDPLFIDVPVTLEQISGYLMWRPDGWDAPAPHFEVKSFDSIEEMMKAMGVSNEDLQTVIKGGSRLQ